jgi:Ion channel
MTINTELNDVDEPAEIAQDSTEVAQVDATDIEEQLAHMDTAEGVKMTECAPETANEHSTDVPDAIANNDVATDIEQPPYIDKEASPAEKSSANVLDPKSAALAAFDAILAACDEILSDDPEQQLKIDTEDKFDDEIIPDKETPKAKNVARSVQIIIDDYDAMEQEYPTECGQVTCSPRSERNLTRTVLTPAASISSHKLESHKENESAVEQLAERIQNRRANRIAVTLGTKREFFKQCRKVANAKKYHSKNLISLEDVKALLAKAKKDLGDHEIEGAVTSSFEYLGFNNHKKDLVQLYERGIEYAHRVDERGKNKEVMVPFLDFSFYEVRTISKWPFLRNHGYIALLVTFVYYLLTPVLFCIIMKDRGICPADPTPKNRPYYGPLSALYFASTTMATVGYGDLSVQKGEDWRLFVAICYMVVSVLVAALAFGAAAENTFSPFEGWYDRVVIRRLLGSQERDEFLFQRTRRLIFATCSSITIQIGTFVLLGVLIQRGFATDVKESQDWTWMTSYYWVVQTVTTIGYGDLDMSFSMVSRLVSSFTCPSFWLSPYTHRYAVTLQRWFQVFYLAFSTYFVGAAIGKLASLAGDIKAARLHFAWNRQEVSKGMIEDMQAYDHDDVVDQYEFCMASLLSLGHIRYEDVKPIMDKFRVLSGGKGFISLTDLPEDNDSYGKDVDEDIDHPADDFY